MSNRYPRRAGPWRPQGAPYYLDHQGERLGLSTLITEHPRVKDNRQLSGISMTTSQACSNYFGAARLGDDRTFSAAQRATVMNVLAPCEAEIAKTHVIAAAATQMVDEAYAAFGIEPPHRNFSVTVASDSVPVTQELVQLRNEVAGLHAEVARLLVQEENANATIVGQREQITKLTAEINTLSEHLTAPADKPAPFDEFESHSKSPKSRTPAKG
jgi:hypothetical protein